MNLNIDNSDNKAIFIAHTLLYILYNMNTEVIWEGYVDKIKDMGKIAFVHLKTTEWLLQLVSFKNSEWDDISWISPWSYLYFTWKKHAANIKDARIENYEIHVEKILVETKADLLPVLDDWNEMDIARKYRHLQLRKVEFQDQFKLATVIELAMVDYFKEKKFIKSWSPKIIWTASEWGAEVFELDFYWQPAFLAQSPQFAKQMMIASWFDRTFDISKAFRADPSRTSRHLAEFVSVDWEMVLKSWQNHHHVMDLLEEMLKNVIQTADKVRNDIEWNSDNIVKWLPDFPRISLSDAKEILISKYDHNVPEWKDIDPEWEKLIGQYVKEKFNSDFVFLIDYPTEFRPFYHMVDSETGLTRSFDLLYKWVEITTWAQREHRYDQLVNQAKTFKKSVEVEDIHDYLELFKYWIAPHGWFGLWLERLTQKYVWKANVKLIPLKAVTKWNIPF